MCVELTEPALTDCHVSDVERVSCCSGRRSEKIGGGLKGSEGETHILAKNCLKERIGNQGQRVDFLGRRRISTSCFAYTATETAVFAYMYVVLMGTLKVNIFR